MACDCDVPRVAFSVPVELRDYAPEGAGSLGLCPRCLDLEPADRDAASGTPEFSRIVEGFPEREPGAAMALAVGLLADSLAMHREGVAACFDRVSDAGADPWLVVERLAVAPTVRPDADLDRLRRQLDQLLD